MIAKKSLILYASLTGNTKKVALRFQKIFEKTGWECDVFKVDQDTDTGNPPFDYRNYDFLCAGSPVISSMPVREILDIMKHPPNPHPHRSPDLLGVSMKEIKRRFAPYQKLLKDSPREPIPKIVFGPDDKKGIVFVTFGGLHRGPKEALPALTLLENEMEHLKFECVGRFACPGRFMKLEGWYKDLSNRPSERDLLKAEIFLEEILEEYY